MVINKIMSTIDYRYKDLLVDWDLLYSQPFEKFVGNDLFHTSNYTSKQVWIKREDEKY